MGIRMHKAVGWGLDLTGLNKDGLNWEVLEDNDLFQDFADDVLQNADDMGNTASFKFAMKSGESNKSLCEMVIYDEEFGLADKALLLPFGYKKHWHRYGNLLDIFEYEAERSYDSPDFMGSDWVEKKGTLYPFVGLMKANPEKPHGVEFYWESCYLNKEGGHEKIAMAPIELMFLIKHLGLTTEDKLVETFLSLRPTIYRYFS